MNNEEVLEIADQYDSVDKYGPAATWNFITEDLIVFARDMQKAERERIKGRVKSAAESVWGIRDFVDKRYGLYIGPSLNSLEQFVEKLMEEE